jgi:hypothetical protein
VRIFNVVIAALFVSSGLAVAQDSGVDSSHAYATLEVKTAPPGIHLFVDGLDAGVTPITLDSLTPGMHTIVLRPPDGDSWYVFSAPDSISLERGDVKSVLYDLPRTFLVTSTPFGADVLVGDSLLGTTPLCLPTESLGEVSIIRLQKQDFEQSMVHLGDVPGRRIETRLTPMWNTDGRGLFKEADSRAPGSLGLYIAGAGTIASGVLAAYFKIEADAHYQEYLRTGDGAHLTKTHRLDTAAGVAIIATQIGLGLVAYLLFESD